jgi:hypothetical protein
VPGRGLPTVSGAHVAVPVHVGDAHDFGLPVDLLQVDPDGLVEGEQFGAQGGAAGVGPAQAQKPDLVDQGAKQHLVAQPGQKRRDAGICSPLIRYRAAFSPILMNFP